MPRRAKGPRLWLRPARRDASNRVTHQATWIIRDRSFQGATGCGHDDLAGAERQLAEYIAGKHVTTAAKGKRRSNEDIPISDALATYGRDVAANRSRPRVGLARLARLIAEIGALPLSEINGSLCRDYAARRGSLSAARRELEDLRAAIGHYHDEGLCRDLPRVILPAKPPNRER